MERKNDQTINNVSVVAPKEEMAKKKFKLTKDKKTRVIAGTLVVFVVAGSIVLFHKNNKKNNVPNDTKKIETEVDTEEKYSRELLEKRTKKFIEEVNNKGIQLSEDEIKNLASVINMERIINEDPELAQELFYGKNAQEIISNAGHTFGMLLTYSFENKYKDSINLSTLIVGGDYDKKILQKLENYRDELTVMRAEASDTQRAELELQEQQRFDEVITDVLNFYMMTSDGLEIDGENAVVQRMNDGSRFSMVLVMNEINLGNNNLLTDDQKKLFESSMTNEPVLENLHKLIEGCQSQEVKNQKVKTK